MPPDNNHPPAPQVTIDIVDNHHGWAFFEPGQRPPALPELPRFLNDSILQWLHKYPERRIRSTLSLVSHGATQCVHLWYDEGSRSGTP